MPTRSRPRDAIEVGARVFLRPPGPADGAEFVRLVQTSRVLHHPWVYPPLDAPGYVALLRESRRADNRTFLVCLLEGRAIAGLFTLSQITGGGFASAYLGYWVGVPFAAQGYMREGLRLLLRHAFERLRLHRLEANIQPGNVASIALARGSGFRMEGFSPRYLKIGGRWRDHQRWAITIEDWRDVRSTWTPGRDAGDQTGSTIPAGTGSPAGTGPPAA